MSFWTRVRDIAGITPNANPSSSVGAPDWNPGDPEGVELQGFDEPSEARSLPFLQPSPWSGYPADWTTPDFSTQTGLNKLVDIAWACLDLNCNVLSAMPVYQTRNGQIIDPVTWMTNPDPTTYVNWQEFAKQLFWDYQLGEAFVLPMATGNDGYPTAFRVIPPWLVTVELKGGSRQYLVGSMDVTNEILHIRYKSNIAFPRGIGPLEMAGLRMTSIGLLQRYANNLAETGGTPQYWIGVDRKLQRSEATDLLESWIESRTKYAGYPAVLTNGSTLNQSTSMNARDMALMELSQFNESRVAVLLGVPPFLVGLAGATGSLTYSNISDLFDYHDRSSLRPKARMVMEALSGWALPSGRACELNRDDYTRLPVNERYTAYATGIKAGFLLRSDVRAMERLSPLSPAEEDLASQEALIAQGTQPLEPGAAGQPGQPGQSTPAQPASTPAVPQNGKSLTAAKALSGGSN